MANKDWAFIEQLAASIEKALHGQDAVVTSPDRQVYDYDTEDFTEVDVSIRFKGGSVPLLVTVECRDRGRVEDKTWIEQLADKKRAIRANATIAVSTLGFGKPAQRKAVKCGIELRHIGKIKDAEIEKWFRSQFVTVRYFAFRAMNIGMEWLDGKVPDGLPANLSIEVDDAWASPLFLEGPERKPLSLNDLMEGHWQGLDDPAIPVGGIGQRTLFFGPEPGKGLYYRHRRREFGLKQIELYVEAKHYRETVPVDKVHQYGAPNDKIIAYAGQATLTTGLDKPLDFIILKATNSDKMTVSTIDRQPWWKRKKKRQRAAR
jgi:hypothetical protein